MNPTLLRRFVLAPFAVMLGLVTFRAAEPSEPTTPKFEDYAVAHVFRGKPPNVDLRSHPKAWTFRTRLREGNSRPPDFAGYYTLVSWGCGTACQENALIDARDGKVYFGPVTSLGSRYRLTSRLLVATAPEDIADYYLSDGAQTVPADNFYVTEYWVWDEEKKSFRLISKQKPGTAVQRLLDAGRRPGATGSDPMR
jgi:hypothetical protein